MYRWEYRCLQAKNDVAVTAYCAPPLMVIRQRCNNLLGRQRWSPKQNWLGQNSQHLILDSEFGNLIQKQYEAQFSDIEDLFLDFAPTRTSRHYHRSPQGWSAYTTTQSASTHFWLILKSLQQYFCLVECLLSFDWLPRSLADPLENMPSRQIHIKAHIV